ncbi:MAG: redoxin domain-containing protein, partial [Planctomycetota bacterium]|jgi:thiol-disulfide isomerase/thioredoxin
MQGAGAAPAVPAATGAVSIPHPLTMLLRDSAAQRELGLGPEQISAVGAALERVELALWRLRDVPAAEGGESAGRLVEGLREELASVLSARQNERLNELVLQALGVAGLLDPGVVERLRLSPGQVGKIRNTVNTLRQDLAALQQSTRGAHQLAQVRAIQAKADQTVVSLLDRRQRVKLKGLMGPGFDLTRVRQAACRAPELRVVNTWVNADAGTLEAMRGQVVVVHFYTFGCINCVRNLPHYVAWQKHFAARPVRMVGIHRPETQGERIVETVRKKAAEAGLKHPIAIDNDSENWDAWANRVWPSVYLVDRKGFVRYWWYGELNWQGIEGERWMRGKIEELLWEER